MRPFYTLHRSLFVEYLSRVRSGTNLRDLYRKLKIQLQRAFSSRYWYVQSYSTSHVAAATNYPQHPTTPQASVPSKNLRSARANVKSRDTDPRPTGLPRSPATFPRVPQRVGTTTRRSNRTQPTHRPPLSQASSLKGSDSYQERGPHTTQLGHQGEQNPRQVRTWTRPAIPRP